MDREGMWIAGISDPSRLPSWQELLHAYSRPFKLGPSMYKHSMRCCVSEPTTPRSGLPVNATSYWGPTVLASRAPASLESCLFSCALEILRTQTDAAPAQQQRRGMFGRKTVTTPIATSAGNTPTDQPTYANQPRGTQTQGAFPDAAQTGTGPRSGELPWSRQLLGQ